MKTFAILRRVLRYALFLLLIAIVALLGLLGFVGFTDTGARLAVATVEDMISTPEQSFSISEPSGLLTGRLRAKSVVLGDTDGRYAELTDVAIDWSPLDLLFFEFNAERVAVASIALDRLPKAAEDSAQQSSAGFSLPVEVDVQSLDLPEITLGEPVLGREQYLALTGSGSATAKRIALKLAAVEPDRPDARLAADILFDPDANALRLEADVSEPENGMLARLLRLPGEPAVDIRLTGDGPLSQWNGKVTAAVADNPVLELDGRHDLSTAGLHTVTLNGGGTFDALLPPQFRPLFAGTTAIDLTVATDGSDVLRIENGAISTGTFRLDASGQATTRGENDLQATLKGADGPLDLTLPMAEGETRVVIDQTVLSLKGPASAAALDVNVAVRSATLPQGQLVNLRLTASSPSFDLARRSGEIDLTLETGTTTLSDANLDRLLKGPIKVAAKLEVTEDSLAFAPVTIESASIGGQIAGSYGLQTQLADVTFQLFALPSVLPEDLAAKFDTTIALRGRATANANGDISVSGAELRSGPLEADVTASLSGGSLDATLSGRVPAIEALAPQAAGEATFEATATGPIDGLSVKARVTAPSLTMSGRTLQSVTLALDGVASSESPSGTIDVDATMNGQAIALDAQLVSANGNITLPEVKATVGENTLEGALALGENFMPDGTIRFAFPDVSTLALLAGQDAAGDLAGTATFTNTDGKGSLSLEAKGASLSRDTVVVATPRLNLTVEDLLTAAAKGTFNAARISIGENEIDTPALDFSHSGNTTGLALRALFEEAPLSLEADIVQNGETIVAALKRLTATVSDIPLTLKETNSVSVTNGVVTLDNLRLGAGDGEMVLAGVIDAAGDSNVTIDIGGENGPARYRLPLDGTDLAVESARVTLSGPLEGAALTIAAKLESLNLPQASVQGADLTARSDAFNLLTRTGAIDADLTVQALDLKNADANRMLAGPVKLAASLSMTGERIVFDSVELDSAGADGTVTGSYGLTDKTASASFTLSVPAEAMPAAAAASFDTPLDLTGKVALAADGTIDLTTFEATSGTVTARGTAKLANNRLEASVDGSLPNLGRMLADASGTANFEASASGPLDGLDVNARLTASGAQLAGRSVSDLVLSLEGKAVADRPSGTLSVTGALDGQPVNIRSNLTSENGQIAIPLLEAEVGPNTLNGKLALGSDFLPEGDITFDFPDLGLLAAMAGQKASGDLKGDVAIRKEDGKTSLTLKANGSGISRDDFKIVDPVVDLRVADLATAAVSGEIKTRSVSSGANRLDDLVLAFTREGTRTGFDLKGRYDGAPLLTEGAIEQSGETIAIAIDRFEATPRKVPVRLSQPTRITIEGGRTALDGLTIGAGRGTIAVSGSAGENLDLAVKITALPASLANTVSAGLGAEGAIAGTVNVKGSAARPVVDYNLTWEGAALTQTKAAGVGAMNIRANGQFADNRVRLETTLSGAGGLNFRGGGTVGITGNMPLDMRFNGTLPFSLLAAQLAQQGFTLTGNATVDLRLSGAATAPVIAGTVATSGGRLVDVRRNLAIENLSARVALDGRQARIESLTGSLASGGNLAASGTVGIQPGSGYPANLTVQLRDITYVDGTLVTANLGGELKVTGPLLSAPVLGGQIRIAKAAITIPQKLPSSLSEIDIKHRNAPADVRQMANDLKADEPADGAGPGIGLNLTVNAPSQIFVRGRGIDAELGGSLTITGTSSNPNVSGGFTLRRGRLDILAKRLDFTSGTIGFGGGLIPTINLVASTTAGATSISVTVSGLANNPNVAFSSSPALPQDEILAQLIFNRSMTNLSAIQIAQLASAVSQLAGGRGGGLLDGLRSKLGVDDLDITTDAEGRAEVTAGKYLNKRTYLELSQDSESGGGKAAINLDIGRGVKLRGEAGTNGGAAGIFYEKEY